jgi:sugar phosphate isomerase/epimerase
MIAGRTVGLAYLTVGGAEPVEHIEAAAAAGFASVGLRVLPPGDLALPHPIVGHPERLRAIERACARTGVRVLDVEVFDLLADTDVAAFAPALDVCAALGAGIVQAVIDDPERGRALERFAALCDAAAERRLGVALEFMMWRTVRTIEEAHAFVIDAGRPNSGLCIDCLHLARSGGSPAAVAKIPAERILYVQLCDAPATLPAGSTLLAEARGGREHPGEGALWLRQLLAVLPPAVPLSLEVPRAVDVDRDPRERARLAAAAFAKWQEMLPRR